MKMYQLFSAYYNGKPAVHEKTLDYILSHEADDLREIRPCIWLWKGDIDPVYFCRLYRRWNRLHSCNI